MDYYYQNSNGERVGPLDEKTFFESAGAGLISAGALVWRSGEDAWRVWADVASAWTNGGGNAPEEREAPRKELISADVGAESVFSEAWAIFKKHWGKLVFVGLFAWASMLFSCTSELASGFSGEAYDDAIFCEISDDGNAAADFADAGTVDEDAVPAVSSDDEGEPMVVMTDIRPSFGAADAGLFAVSFLLEIILGIFVFGILKIVRKTDAGTPVSFGDLFPLGRCLRKLPKFIGLWFVLVVLAGALGVGICLPLLVTSVFAAVVVLVALCAFFVLAPRLVFAIDLLFDTDCGVFESLRASWRITRGRFWRTLGFGILFYAIAFFCSAFTLSFGAIALYPLFALWTSVYYVKLCKTADADVPASVLALK